MLAYLTAPVGCAPFWSTWHCPRGLLGWPWRRGHPGARGVEPQAPTVTCKPTPLRPAAWVGRLGRRVRRGAARPLLPPGAQPARLPPAALLIPFSPARPLTQGPHSAYKSTSNPGEHGPSLLEDPPPGPSARGWQSRPRAAWPPPFPERVSKDSTFDLTHFSEARRGRPRPQVRSSRLHGESGTQHW